MTTCPICETETAAQREGTPYWICPTCDLWFQDPQPPKIYMGAHEPDPEAMSDEERAINKSLAHWLYTHVMGGTDAP